MLFVLSVRDDLCLTLRPFLVEKGGLTDWLSGSGGAGETSLNDCFFARKPRSAKKRHSRCPLQPVLGSFRPIKLPYYWKVTFSLRLPIHLSMQSTKLARVLYAIWKYSMVWRTRPNSHTDPKARHQIVNSTLCSQRPSLSPRIRTRENQLIESNRQSQPHGEQYPIAANEWGRVGELW